MEGNIPNRKREWDEKIEAYQRNRISPNITLNVGKKSNLIQGLQSDKMQQSTKNTTK